MFFTSNIEATLKPLGMTPLGTSNSKFTVPAIHHIPTNTYMMDSTPISQFLERTYPNPSLPLSTDWGQEIEKKARGLLGPVLRTSIVPREILILSPRSQDYFRRTREEAFGRRLEELLDEGKEEEMGRELDGEMVGVGGMMRRDAGGAGFVFGEEPCYTDFLIAGAMESVRMVDEGIFQRMVKYRGFSDVYTACLPLMEKND
ncbi:unnamed protein product [Periconia digitata]|uniref:Glutathione S-transferase UstS-like C-terminal domain-containing protein n=1 Tax=Periconia digitata TaxID=1303443 RepID=A0A9W4UNT1_9PLEO|nr:unnamed protein product [Periconia digitata]